MTAHLGCWVSDLADGQLDGAATERALAHVAVCPRCAAELESARAAHRALAAARDVAPDPGLTDRLLALSASIPPVEGDPLRGAGGARTWERHTSWEPTLTGDLRARRRRQRRARATAVGAGGVGLLGVVLLTLGQGPVFTPDSSRSAALSLLAGASDVAALPGVGVSGVTDGDRTAAALAWLEDHGWATPSGLPPGYEVTALRLVEESGAAASSDVPAASVALADGGASSADATRVVELDLTGPDGAVVVRQRQGRLAEPATATGLPVPGHDVQVLSGDPWHVAWQAGDVAVEVTADVPEDVLTDVVAAFPGGGYDAGVLPQLSRGWTTVTGALSRP
ncbi:hypothetical protein GCM10009809_05730 [Isoptericola hypogeus]|uniref:Zinc finger protein n=1 Tax=Isoptericola hypogeus TaxID=300179 RepID=A0ABN2IVK2_9MICO